MSQSLSDSLLAQVLERNESMFTVVSEATSEEVQPQTLVSDALQSSALSVFSKMCDINLELSERSDAGCAARHHDVSGIITISGELRATVALHFPSVLIFACAEKFLGTRPTKLDADTIDLVGELTNMVVGAAKEKCGRDGLSLGLPTVVAGRDHQIAFGSDMRTSTLSFASKHGALAIDVGVKV